MYLKDKVCLHLYLSLWHLLCVMFAHQQDIFVMEPNMLNCHCHSWNAHDSRAPVYDRMNTPDNVREGNFRRNSGRVDSHTAPLNMSMPQPNSFPQQTSVTNMDYDSILFGSGHNSEPHAHWKNDASMELDSIGSTTTFPANRGSRASPMNFVWPEQAPPNPHK